MARRDKRNSSRGTTSEKSGANPADKYRKKLATLKQASELLSGGDLNGAEKLSRKLLQEDPAYLGALQILGAVSLKKENFKQAVDCFVTAAADAPDDWRNFFNLGSAWIGLEKPEIASLMLSEAVRLNPDSSEAHRLLGETAIERRDYLRAISSLEAAIARDPKNFKAMIQLADCRTHLGDLKKASELLLSVYRERPEWIGVLQKLHKMPAELIDIDFASAIRNAETSSGAKWAHSVRLRQFLAASILHRAGEHDRAWDLLEETNNTLNKHARDALQESRRRRMRWLDVAKRATIAKVDHTPHSDELSPLFLVGVSRSGKTTLETILSSHPAIQRGFESRNVRDASVRASQTGGLPNIRYLDELPVQLYGAFAKNYFARLKRDDRQQRFHTETNPINVGAAAQLAVALPSARFVFVTRDRDDLAVRIFMTYYDTGNTYAYGIRDTYDYIDWYEEMTGILLEKIGDRAIHIRYEDMVADPGAAANKVFKLCGLDGSGVSIDPVGNDVGAAAPYKAKLAEFQK